MGLMLGRHLQNLVLTGAFYVGNGRVAWGLLGLLFVIVDHSRKFPTFSTSKHNHITITRSHINTYQYH